MSTNGSKTVTVGKATCIVCGESARVRRDSTMVPHPPRSGACVGSNTAAHRHDLHGEARR